MVERTANEEILRITNESTSIIENRIKSENKWLIWITIGMIIISHYALTWQIGDVKDVLKQLIEDEIILKK